MTEQFPPPPQFPPVPPGDAKAQAAAAKAYAKAQRPWYKKKRFMIPLVLVVLGIIGSAAGGSGSNNDDKATQKASNVQTEQPAANNTQKETPKPAKPKPTKKAGLSWGNWEVVGRLQVTKEEYTGDFAVVTRVRNTKDEADTGLFTVTILKGDEILGTADCTTPEIDPGQIGTADCLSTDNYKAGYTSVTIEDSF